MSSLTSASNSSQIDPDMKIVCVYALSGTYGMLPRFLYYITLVFAIFGRTKEWLVIGALVSSLAYAGTSAIHGMALCNSRQGVFDLDAFGSWAILSTAALAYIAMIHWSSSIRNSRARIVMVIWGMLVGVALIFNRAILYDQPFEGSEKPCYSFDGKLLTSPSELSSEFNCTYKCFNVRKPMRGRDEIVAVSESVVNNGYWHLSYILVGPVMFAAYAAISYDTRGHTPSQLCTRQVVEHLNPNLKEDLVKMIWNASHETWYGGYFLLIHYMRRLPWNRHKILVYTLAYPWIVIGLVMDVLCLPFMVVNVILNELNLLRSGMPVNESIYNVGQWSPIVNSALVLIAAIINKGLEMWEERKAQKAQKAKEDAESTPQRIHRVDTEATLVEDTDLDPQDHKQPSRVYFENSDIDGDPGSSRRAAYNGSRPG